MEEIQWIEEAKKREDEFINDIKQLLQIKSVYDEASIGENAPFGEGIKEALEHMLALGEKDGFTVKNIDGYAGHIEYGEGEEIIGILCHLDVVPEGDGWTSHPFQPEIRNGKLYARGAMDDKGPTMAAYYGLKMIKELGLPLNKKVRVILGCDEESNWRCMDHYFKKETMPTIGFAPDADFPLIFAEKGLGECYFVFPTNNKGTEKTLVSFKSGRRLNMVPDLAEAIVQGYELESVQATYEVFLEQYGLEGSIRKVDNTLHFQLKGVSAHGAEPFKGINAAIYLAHYLKTLELDEASHQFVSFLSHYFIDDVYGEKLGIAFEDTISGKLTVNVGIINYTNEKGAKIGINLRCPVEIKEEQVWSQCEAIANKHGITFVKEGYTPPHHVDLNHKLVKTLLSVYQKQTGDYDSKPIAIGGGTYARTLKTGVAFGALFPGEPDTFHQKDEYATVANLIKAMGIYGEAIYQLAK
ncbi:MAG: dipeptidase PepV [Bacillaceae bacterium]